jgi:hypothetical protein
MNADGTFKAAVRPLVSHDDPSIWSAGRGQQGHDAARCWGRGNCFVAEGRLGETAGRTGYHESIPQGIGLHEDQSAA